MSAGLGSSAIFSWDFSFGNLGDFEKVVWGQTDKNDLILNNYITIWKSGLAQKNPKLDNSFKSRLSWARNISQHGCQVEFSLKNVTKSDETRTYGCTAYVSGTDYRSGPIKLVVLSEYEHSQLFFGVKFQPDNLVLSFTLTNGQHSKRQF